MRGVALDGALLAFDRDSGARLRVDGDEVRGLRLGAPLAVQFGLTNACNLACGFCSRDTTAASAWTADSAFVFLRDLAARGVLEVAFGGGEPFAFRGFAELVARIHDHTPLAVHATTNGVLVRDEHLVALRGKLGELRLSVYDDNGWRRTAERLIASGQRFGLNWLLWPDRVDALTDTILQFAELGVRDVLVLSYNGPDRAMHLSADQVRRARDAVRKLHAALPTVRLSLDVCWGDRMEPLPRWPSGGDCGAGRAFVVVTSDRRVAPCSFHDVSVPFDGTAAGLLRVWRGDHGFGRASSLPGCARASGFGLEAT